MKIRSYMMYSAMSKLTKFHRKHGQNFYVRAEPSRYHYDHAMEHEYNPLPGENFMNSVPARFKGHK